MTRTNASKIYNLVGSEAVLTEDCDLRQYLTGLSTSFGYVLSDNCGTVFYTDARYLEAAKTVLKGTEIAVEQYKNLDFLKKYKRLAIPIERTPFPVYQKYKALGLEIYDSMQAFTSAMSVKENYELENVKRACEIADKAFLRLLDIIKEGMTENEVAANLEFLMRSFGASGTSFPTIVAFGENSSVPHHETGFKKLKYGDIILIDFGCKFNGYCSDCTRTFLFGDDNKHGEFKTAYSKVLEAHNLVKEKTTCGMKAKEADAIARSCLKKYNLDKYFTHSLGHGIGINIHEFPYLSPKSEEIILNNMVFSDEPGIYLEGRFGIRIEDTVTLSDGNVISLTDSDKSLLIL